MSQQQYLAVCLIDKRRACSHLLSVFVVIAVGVLANELCLWTPEVMQGDSTDSKHQVNL